MPPWKNNQNIIITLLFLLLHPPYNNIRGSVTVEDGLKNEDTDNQSIGREANTRSNQSIVINLNLSNDEKSKLMQEDSKQTDYREFQFSKDDFAFIDLEKIFPQNELVYLEGGSFIMGYKDSPFPGDGEAPERTVIISPYAIDKYEVSNGEFAEFVRATNYITEAEQFGNSFVMDYFVSKEVNEKISEAVANAQWWLPVEDANWKHPEGKDSHIKNRTNHPVVHVSWNDARAYCFWKAKRLPTEAEWEFACRGGKQKRLFPWGNEFNPNNEHRANIWQGRFPTENTAEDGCAGTCAVDSFLQNRYGLHNMVGNVWEWVVDWWSVNHEWKPTSNPQGPSSGESKVKKGGSFMCSKEFCYRYRCAARSSNSADSSASNLGFRCVKSGEKPAQKDEL